MSSETGELSGMASRLRDIRTRLGFTQKEIASKVGKSQQSWANYESGHSNPPVEVVRRLVSRHGVNGSWLLTGEGEMMGDDLTREKPAKPFITEQLPDDFDPESVSFVPVYGAPLGAGQAGNAAMVKVRGYMAWEKAWLRREAQIDPARAFVAQVFGQSMEQLLENGDLVLGEMQDQVDHDGVYAIRLEDELYIKHVVRQQDSILMVSENDIYGRMEVDRNEDFSVIGRIVVRVGDL